MRLPMKNSNTMSFTRLRRWMSLCGVACLLTGMVTVAQAEQGVRHIAVDVKGPSFPTDRFYNFSVGSDYPGTLMRDDSLAQLKTVRDELGFCYIRFHAIFHDVLGTYREVDGKPVYDWTKI